MSFSELFRDLAKYIDDPNRRWRKTVRVKRGITDTTVPGGLYKDQAYLEGAMKILHERKNLDFYALYSGKINVEDLSRPFMLKIIRMEELYMPTFFSDMKRYHKALDIIAKANFVQ